MKERRYLSIVSVLALITGCSTAQEDRLRSAFVYEMFFPDGGTTIKELIVERRL